MARQKQEAVVSRALAEEASKTVEAKEVQGPVLSQRG